MAFFLLFCLQSGKIKFFSTQGNHHELHRRLRDSRTHSQPRSLPRQGWGNDVPEGKLTSFTMAVKREENESIVFSWITWPSKNARDEGWKVVMQDPIMQSPDYNLFDGKRMIFGGFETIVQA